MLIKLYTEEKIEKYSVLLKGNLVRYYLTAFLGFLNNSDC